MTLRYAGFVAWFLIGLLIGASVELAHARDGGQWQGQSPTISKWLGELMQPDNVMVSCCGEADAYEADDFVTDGDHVVAIITDERVVEGRPALAVGTRIPIPPGKVKWDAGNPTGHGWVFLSMTQQVYCWVAPGGV